MRIFLIALAILPALASAEETIYRCRKGGEMVVQQMPCGERRQDAMPAKPAPAKPMRFAADPGGQYFILERGGDDRLRTLTTRRVGSSGETYSKREFDCTLHDARYLGTGSTLEKMKAAKPEANRMTPVAGSIAEALLKEACRD